MGLIQRQKVIDRFGQFVWISSKSGSNLKIDTSGRDERQKAYVVHLTKDFRDDELNVNDRLVEVGGRKVSLYVWRVDFAAHYNGKFTLMKVHLKDRRSQ